MAANVVPGDEGNPLMWPQERAEHSDGFHLPAPFGPKKP